MPPKKPGNRIIRGWILKTIEYAYPDGAGEQLIAITLDDLGFNNSPGELETHLVYLEDKGYITRQKVSDRAIALQRNIARLTTKGVDLLEGNIGDDPGIIVEV